MGSLQGPCNSITLGARNASTSNLSCQSGNDVRTAADVRCSCRTSTKAFLRSTRRVAESLPESE
eukprot:8456190-Pyramimonas_sp.AAC.1